MLQLLYNWFYPENLDYVEILEDGSFKVVTNRDVYVGQDKRWFSEKNRDKVLSKSKMDKLRNWACGYWIERITKVLGK